MQYVLCFIAVVGLTWDIFGELNDSSNSLV